MRAAETKMRMSLVLIDLMKALLATCIKNMGSPARAKRSFKNEKQ